MKYVLIAALLFSFPSLANDYALSGTVTIPNLPTGAQGDSAYQVAINNGFIGTEQEWLDSLKGPSGNGGGDCINALDYGFVKNDANFDNSIILNQFIADTTLQSNQLCFPQGDYAFKTQTDEIDRRINIKGVGVGGTRLQRYYVGPLLHATSTVIIENMTIHVLGGNNGSFGVHLKGLGASASVLRNLYITSTDGSTYQAAVYIDGENQTLGIRGVYMEQIEAFASTSHNIWLQNVKGLVANGIQTYLAGGTVQHIIIQDRSGFRSDSILITTRYAPTIYAYNSDNIKVLTAATTAKGGAGYTNFVVY